MLESDLDKVKQFENVIKGYLIKEFGEYIPNDRVTLLYGRNYADEIKSNKDNEESVNGELTRKMLDDLINVSCYKEIRVSDELVIPLPYGISLEDAIINYFANKLSEKYGFKIDKIPGLLEDMEIVAELDKKLDGNLAKRVFNEDALSLLKGSAFSEIVQKYDDAALADYLINVDSLSNESLDQEKTNELLNETLDNQNMEIVTIEGKQYMKYVDENGQAQYTPVESQAVKEEIKETLTSQDGTTVNAKDLNDSIQKEANYMMVNMMDFVKSNGKINEMTSTNQTVKQTEPVEEQEQIRQITKEEYEDLCQRFANNEELSLEELKMLRNANPEFLEEAGPILKPKNASGYASPSFAFYFALLFAVLCISLSLYIFFN